MMCSGEPQCGCEECERYADNYRLEFELEQLKKQCRELKSALKEALEGWEYAAKYKGDFLSKKHGDFEDISKLRKLLEKN